ncbi:hypothetical protein DBV23_02075 [Edwardsiella ictaluri]|nr:hypothetical protein DBV23_02075 [Edwardsiella ictaluri]
MALGCAHHSHLLRVHSGCCALSVSKLVATIYSYWDRLLFCGFYYFIFVFGANFLIRSVICPEVDFICVILSL